MNKTFILQLHESYATGTLIIVKPSIDDVKIFLNQVSKEFNDADCDYDKCHTLYEKYNLTCDIDTSSFNEEDSSYWEIVKEFNSDLPDGVVYSDYYSG